MERRQHIISVLIVLVTMMLASYEAAAQHFVGKCDTALNICITVDKFASDEEDISDLNIDGIEFYKYERITVGKYSAVSLDSIAYIIYESNDPIVALRSSSRIINEPKVGCDFEIYQSEKNSIFGILGAELRGAYSLANLPKKNFDLEVWTDEISQDSRDITIGTLREDDDWILDAMYNEPLRIRSAVALRLWKTIQQHDNNNDIVSSFDNRFCDLFINGEYRGIYALTEPVDRKQLGLNKRSTGSPGSLIRAIAYTPQTLFASDGQFSDEKLVQHGFKLTYPKQAPDWSYLEEFSHAVQEATSENLADTVKAYMHWDNLVNYFLFVQFTNASDNLSNNIYYSRKSTQDKFKLTIWDVDGTFGNDFRGEQLDSYLNIRSSVLFNRLLQADSSVFYQACKRRYHSLRNFKVNEKVLNILVDQELQRFATAYRSERENLRWNYNSDSNVHITNFKNFLDIRLAWLDDYFEYSVFSNTQNLANKSQIRVFPNPTKGVLQVSFQNPTDDANIVSVLDMNGLILKTCTVQDISNGVDLSSLVAGDYMLCVDGRDCVKITKS